MSNFKRRDLLSKSLRVDELLKTIDDIKEVPYDPLFKYNAYTPKPSTDYTSPWPTIQISQSEHQSPNNSDTDGDPTEEFHNNGQSISKHDSRAAKIERLRNSLRVQITDRNHVLSEMRMDLKELKNKLLDHNEEMLKEQQMSQQLKEHAEQQWVQVKHTAKGIRHGILDVEGRVQQLAQKTSQEQRTLQSQNEYLKQTVGRLTQHLRSTLKVGGTLHGKIDELNNTLLVKVDLLNQQLKKTDKLYKQQVNTAEELHREVGYLSKQNTRLEKESEQWKQESQLWKRKVHTYRSWIHHLAAEKPDSTDNNGQSDQNQHSDALSDHEISVIHKLKHKLQKQNDQFSKERDHLRNRLEQLSRENHRLTMMHDKQHSRMMMMNQHNTNNHDHFAEHLRNVQVRKLKVVDQASQSEQHTQSEMKPAKRDELTRIIHDIRIERDRNQSLSEELKKLTLSCHKLLRVNHRNEQTIVDLKQRLSQTEGKLSDSKRFLDLSRQNLAQVQHNQQKSMNKVRSENSSFKGEIRQLRRSVDQLTNENERIRHYLDQKREYNSDSE